MNVIYEGEPVLRPDIERIVATAQAGGALDLVTSGTTGTPKTIRADLGRALRRLRTGDPADRYVLTFHPGRWAGVSVVLHCHQIGCTLIVPPSFDPPVIAAACVTHRPTHISLTPSLFRLLVMRDAGGALRQVPLRQITFGGEAAPQSVLDLARAHWPAARITHTYASTEHGDICAVSDGCAGFPAAKFERFAFVGGGADGELVIDGFSTGDVWRRDGDRFLFVGRHQEFINVGGNKVSPTVVEEAALAAGAAQARAYGVPSPLLGRLVALDYAGAIGPQDLRRSLIARLPKFACPAQVNRVAELTLSDAGKLSRHS